MIAYCPHHTQHLLPREEPDVRPPRYVDVCNANSPSFPRTHVTASLCFALRVCLVVVERDELRVYTIVPIQVSSHSFRRDDMSSVDIVLIRIAALDANVGVVGRL